MLLFAGTTEGRRLYQLLLSKGVDIDVCVATEYGKEMLDMGCNSSDASHVFAKRLDKEQMKALITKNKYRLVVDATHPYATEVTKNICDACEELGVEYVRIIRHEGEYEDVVCCKDIFEAVDFFSSNDGNILSTIGSKELHILTGIKGWQKRVYARILPLPEAVNACVEMGFAGSHLICMQGPFSQELNLAMLKQYECKYMLTKSSGDAGGFEEKINAAKNAGARIVLIARPQKEAGLTFDEAVNYIEAF